MALNNLTEVNANGAAISAAMAILAVVHADAAPEYVRAHPAQIASWLNQCMTVNSELKVELLKGELPVIPRMTVTLGGVPLREDPKLFPDRVVYHSIDGTAVSRITGLAIPVGYDFPAMWNCNTTEEYERRIKEEGWLFE
jgi:hypothetical protein